MWRSNDWMVLVAIWTILMFGLAQEQTDPSTIIERPTSASAINFEFQRRNYPINLTVDKEDEETGDYEKLEFQGEAKVSLNDSIDTTIVRNGRSSFDLEENRKTTMYEETGKSYGTREQMDGSSSLLKTIVNRIGTDRTATTARLLFTRKFAVTLQESDEKKRAKIRNDDKDGEEEERAQADSKMRIEYKTTGEEPMGFDLFVSVDERGNRNDVKSDTVEMARLIDEFEMKWIGKIEGEQTNGNERNDGTGSAVFPIFEIGEGKIGALVISKSVLNQLGATAVENARSRKIDSRHACERTDLNFNQMTLPRADRVRNVNAGVGDLGKKMARNEAANLASLAGKKSRIVIGDFKRGGLVLSRTKVASGRMRNDKEGLAPKENDDIWGLWACKCRCNEKVFSLLLRRVAKGVTSERANVSIDKDDVFLETMGNKEKNIFPEIFRGRTTKKIINIGHEFDDNELIRTREEREAGNVEKRKTKLTTGDKKESTVRRQLESKTLTQLIDAEKDKSSRTDSKLEAADQIAREERSYGASAKGEFRASWNIKRLENTEPAGRIKMHVEDQQLIWNRRDETEDPVDRGRSDGSVDSIAVDEAGAYSVRNFKFDEDPHSTSERLAIDPLRTVFQKDNILVESPYGGKVENWTSRTIAEIIGKTDDRATSALRHRSSYSESNGHEESITRKVIFDSPESNTTNWTVASYRLAHVAAAELETDMKGRENEEKEWHEIATSTFEDETHLSLRTRNKSGATDRKFAVLSVVKRLAGKVNSTFGRKDSLNQRRDPFVLISLKLRGKEAKLDSPRRNAAANDRVNFSGTRFSRNVENRGRVKSDLSAANITSSVSGDDLEDEEGRLTDRDFFKMSETAAGIEDGMKTTDGVNEAGRRANSLRSLVYMDDKQLAERNDVVSDDARCSRKKSENEEAITRRRLAEDGVKGVSLDASSTIGGSLGSETHFVGNDGAPGSNGKINRSPPNNNGPSIIITASVPSSTVRTNEHTERRSDDNDVGFSGFGAYESTRQDLPAKRKLRVIGIGRKSKDTIGRYRGDSGITSSLRTKGSLRADRNGETTSARRNADRSPLYAETSRIGKIGRDESVMRQTAGREARRRRDNDRSLRRPEESTIVASPTEKLLLATGSDESLMNDSNATLLLDRSRDNDKRVITNEKIRPGTIVEENAADSEIERSLVSPLYLISRETGVQIRPEVPGNGEAFPLASIEKENEPKGLGVVGKKLIVTPLITALRDKYLRSRKRRLYESSSTTIRDNVDVNVDTEANTADVHPIVQTAEQSERLAISTSKINAPTSTTSKYKFDIAASIDTIGLPIERSTLLATLSDRTGDRDDSTELEFRQREVGNSLDNAPSPSNLKIDENERSWSVSIGSISSLKPDTTIEPLDPSISTFRGFFSTTPRATASPSRPSLSVDTFVNIAATSTVSPVSSFLQAVRPNRNLTFGRTDSDNATRASSGLNQWPVKHSAVVEGDLVLGGLMMVHEREDSFTCGPVMPQGGVQALEAMLYTLDRLNNEEIVPGVKIGAHILDDCDKDTYGLEMAVDFIKGSISNIDGAEDHCNKTAVRKVISGVVGAASSVTSIQVANLLRLFRIPQVSFFSTSPELSNKQRFEYFTRTIPSDHYQVKAMVDIVRKMGWSYVSIIYEESNYGIKAFEELEDLLAKYRICIAIKEKLVKDSGVAKETAYDNIVQKLLTKPRARGCIIFGSDQEVAGVMRAVRRCNATGAFSWIGSDGWSARELVSDGNEAEVEGTLSVQPQANPVRGFEQYFLNLTVENNKRNPWFVEFWENHFQCRYPNSSWTPYNTKYAKQCTTRERLTKQNTAFEDQLQFVSDAVMAFAYAFRDMHEDLCRGKSGLCDTMKPTKGTELLKYLRKVDFEGLSGDKFRFDKNGDGPARYNIIHFKQTSPGRYRWIRVGKYLEGELRLNMSEIQFRMGHPQPPESVCSLPCEVGQAKKYVEGESCCWHCFNCTQYQIRHTLDETQCVLCPQGTVPDETHSNCRDIPEEFLRPESGWAIGAMSFSATGILVTLFVGGVFLRHNDTPVVRASGRELSYVLLTGILLCYLVTFALILRPTDVVCGIQRFAAGFCFTVVYAALLTKTNRISRIFNAGKHSAKRPSFISPRSQLIICSGLVGVQILINGVWMVIDPARAMYYYPTRDDNLLVCNSYIDASYMIAFTYPIILIVVCTVYAILTRKIPEAFNESKHIGFTMYTTCVIWLAFVPLYFGTGNHVALRITSMSVTISLSASVTIACLFSPKLYIILIRPERNVRQSMMPFRHSTTKSSAVTGTNASSMMAAVTLTAATCDQNKAVRRHAITTIDCSTQSEYYELELQDWKNGKASVVLISRSTQTLASEKEPNTAPATAMRDVNKDAKDNPGPVKRINSVRIGNGPVGQKNVSL